MQSFISEIENPIVQQDIIELEKKIALFHQGKIDEERFRSLRLARGVYGQRQEGVQMIRIKVPYGKLTAAKLRRIASVSDEYSRGRLHITTRQDIQIHHVSLNRTPELWADLEKDEVTLREACGNTVRNVTSSETAGIDPNEAFDIRCYVDAVVHHFLRKPICQEMGRKIKFSFSNTDADTALAYMHDAGMIAKVKTIDGKEVHGFEVWIGGGIGSQPHLAYQYSEFTPVDELIPILEAVLRVFERYGERNRRMKARLKFIIKDMGAEAFNTLVAEELAVLPKTHPIPYTESKITYPSVYNDLKTELSSNDAGFKLWKSSNVITQKDGHFAIGIKVRLGDFYTDQARVLADHMEQYSGNEMTLTINQNLIIRHIEEKALVHWYELLNELKLADIGFNTFSDITACPGTDTCNLGIASSTGLAKILETVLVEEYPQLATDPTLDIKMSGCMNACGQHMISAIGFQGMSMRTKDKKVLPAAQVIIGGGTLGNGHGQFGEKVIKIPSKRTPKAMRIILDDFQENRSEGQSFLEYYAAVEKNYHYNILKELTSVENVTDEEMIDWGHSAPYIKAIGVGECAGVVIDLISTLFFETEEKIELARRTLESGEYQDSIYHTYAAIVNTAKAILLSEDIAVNTHIGIINTFDEQFVDSGKFHLDKPFKDIALKLKQIKADAISAAEYLGIAKEFYKSADKYRTNQLQTS